MVELVKYKGHADPANFEQIIQDIEAIRPDAHNLAVISQGSGFPMSPKVPARPFWKQIFLRCTRG